MSKLSVNVTFTDRDRQFNVAQIGLLYRFLCKLKSGASASGIASSGGGGGLLGAFRKQECSSRSGCLPNHEQGSAVDRGASTCFCGVK